MTNYSSLAYPSRVGGLSYSFDPTSTADSSVGFMVGDEWTNTATGIIWVCINNTQGAATWVPLVRSTTFKLAGANMNATTDQPIALPFPSTAKLYVSKVTVANASVSLTTAAGGLYTAASKGGTAIVAASQAYSGLTSSALVIEPTIAARPALAGNANVYFALTTAQGAAATADVYVTVDILF